MKALIAVLEKIQPVYDATVAKVKGLLVDDAGNLLKRAWSVRLMVLAAIFGGVEQALPLLEGYIDIPPRLFAGLSGLTTTLALVARFLVQKNLTKETSNGE